MANNPSQRPRKRNKETRRDLFQSMIILILAVICIGMITFTMIAMSQQTDPQLQKPNSNETTDPVAPSNNPFSPEKDDGNHSHSAEDNAVSELIKQTDFIAAGYDYAKAIQMLKDSEYYGSNKEIAEKEAEYQKLDSELVVYAKPDTITHIFFHSLIVDPERAFDKDVDQDGYNMYMTTVKEFNAILEAMYQKGYVLISPYDMAYEVTDDSGTHFTYGQIRLPAGKIPFIMSQDDLNYYSYMIGTGSGINETPVFADTNGDGFAHKIVIGDDGIYGGRRNRFHRRLRSCSGIGNIHPISP